MCDKQIGQPQSFLKLFQHIDDLCLDRYIQCRDRLITDNKLRLHGQCPGYSDTLSLPSRKLMREAGHMVFIKPYHLQQLFHPLIYLFLWNALLF